MNPLCTSQVALTDEDMKFLERLDDEEDVMGVIEFMDKRKIPNAKLDTKELMERCWLEYWRQKRDSPKVTVSRNLCRYINTPM